jgi:diketogulonate reductase-like aldo/keto reductase
MKERNFGSPGKTLPLIGQGSWQFSGNKAALEETKNAIRAGIANGMTHIDTAEMYGDSELIIADAIKGLPRDELFIVSKVLPSHATFQGTIKACDNSLKRLAVDYLDCYLLHWRGNHPLADTMAALEKLIDDGKIRSLGVSNFDEEDLKEAEQLLKKHKIACNQVLYNLEHRGIERKLIPLCQQNEIALVGYTPFGQNRIPDESNPKGKVLAQIGKRHNASIRQIILAFLVRLDNTFAIPKASKTAHTLENAKAGDIELSSEDIAEIDRAFPAPNKDVPLSML